ncbi:MAG: MBL fold metallo-hydrolase [Desulfobacterales bacterium]|uniref:MBL fold metallo-hydrolase n=1 Tax=Candidatus Desulfatibia vada TaxID=2841696 RepID=A0A8J6P0S3_9BACT|nr:MBL fold metallo-hydrolase [Candidatus Desulfatibia vada]
MNADLSASLKAADRVEILTLIDNYIDLLLPATDIVTRPPLAKEGKILADTLLAEHGLSLLITVYQGEAKHTILLDTGYTKVGVPHNMERLGIDADDIEAIVISHGHMDHTGSLYAILDKLPGRIPLVLHPGAFVHPRYTRAPDGAMRLWPQTLVQDDLEQENVEIVASKTPTLIAADMILVTGEVERTTAFEKGMPNALLEKDGEYVQDPIKEDQALVINLAGKGLVVISGCAHAGIVNTVEYAKKLAGEETIHAVLGGFHLTGPFFEKIHDETVDALKKMEPEVVMPMHCTGWRAIQKFQKEFSSNFILNSVGSKLTL